MGKVLGTAKIREKGEITIPKDARDYLDMKPGDRVTIIFEDGKVIIKKTEIVHSDFKTKD